MEAIIEAGSVEFIPIALKLLQDSAIIIIIHNQ
jgi:hypothetical protein